MRVRIEPSLARGVVMAPPSKSMAHRMLICAGLAKGESLIEGVSYSQDVLATIGCLRALGASVTVEGDCVRVIGADLKTSASAVLDCNESGSTLRFFLPLCLLSDDEKSLVGSARLMERPQQIYSDLCKEKGISFSQTGEKITVQGRLSGGVYTVDGSVSSQFISGLLFALPLLDTDSTIRILPAPQSRPYIELTRAAQKTAGVESVWTSENELFVRGNQTYRAFDTRVEGDYSNAAFLDALSIVGGRVRVEGLLQESGQGDRVYKDYFERIARKDPMPMDLSDCPDLAPILFAIAAIKGGGEFVGTERLKWKECDRGAAMKEELSAFGARLVDYGNRIVVEACPLHAPDRILSSHNDHRIVMSLAVLLTVFGGEIEGAEAVKKSMPEFFDLISALGVKVNYVS